MTDKTRVATVDGVPSGWVFVSADFSLQAHGRASKGQVMLQRDADNTRRWHSLPDAVTDASDGPALFAQGYGATLAQAIAQAAGVAVAAGQVPGA